MRSTRLLALLAAVSAVFGLGGIASADPAPPPLQLYAAPYGVGSLCSWFLPCSVTNAQQQVRQLDQNMHRDIKVNLAGGTYRLAAPLQLTARDSGSNGFNVIWAAEPGATPVLSGGRQITGWHLTDPSRNVWSAPAPANLQTRQLYVNGVRAQRASGPLPVKLTVTPTGYTASSDAMASWRNPGDLEFVYTGGAPYWSLKVGGEGAWTEPRCPVASISGTTITMAQPCWDNSTKRIQRTDGSGRSYNLVHNGNLDNGTIPAYVDNAYELLDQPGQWYLDSSAHQIYYIPRAGEQLSHADVEAPVLQQLVTGQGTATAPVHNIEFTGVQFSYATWLTPSTGDGFSEVQANYTMTGQGAYATQGLCQFIPGGSCPYGNWTKEPGNLSFSYDSDIQFLNDAFVHLGAAGLDLGDGSRSDTVQGSVFTDISGNGLEIGGVDIPEPTSQAQHTSSVSVLDNHLYDLPVEYRGGVAIDVGYAEHTLISHNQIDHTAYTAISLGWGGWPDKISVAATPNYSNNNTVSDNQITDAMQMLADGGAIYTQGITGTSMADGEHLTGNVISGILDNGHAMYCDNGCTYWTADDNVLVGNISNDWGARHTDYTAGQTGDDPLEVSGNYWWQGEGDSNSKNTVVNGNHVIANLANAPAAITSAAGLEPRYRHILNERFDKSAPNAPDQVAAFAVNGSAYVGWNPTFVDNGAPVTSYTVTASPGGANAILSAADLAKVGYVVIPGLTNGTGYTFTVTAHNANGASAPSLPSATVTPTPATVSSEKFTWPGVAAGQPDNVVATGQTIPASGSGASLGILATASYGPATGAGTVTYSDGTSQPITMTVPDWYATPPGGANIAFTSGYRNRPGNVQQTHQTTVCYLNVPLDPTKTVTGIVLPSGAAPVSGTPAIHVFAINIGSTPVDLTAACNNVGVSDDTATAAGNLDGAGSSFSAQALAASGITPGATIATQSASPGAPTAVSASPGDGAVSIHFTPPSSAGISPIIGYTITAPGIAPIQVTGHDFLWAGSGNAVYTVAGGLTNGTPYTFTITADNVAGPGATATVTATPNPTS
ncbi:MAG TPA: fibronectin type III domain-containing protein [Pseudonocardiaceae bacterium]|nr:fibronectin type III domain-containing protein [Pseudonocardiaceae bacterium]